MEVNFYNEYLIKYTHGTDQVMYDFSCAKMESDLTNGEDYAVEVYPDRPYVVKSVHDIKSMEFEIKNVKEFSSSDNFHICSVKVLSYENGTEYPKVENVVVAGYFYNVYPEAIYAARGYWSAGKDGRDIFIITERDQIVSSSENSLKKYLSFLLKGTGIGKQVINKLFDEFHFRTLDKIKEQDEKLLDLIKNEKKRACLIDIVTNSEENEKALNFLIQNNVSAESAIEVIKALGSTSFSKIMGNPYILHRFNTIPIERINAMAKKIGATYKNTDNIQGLILRYLAYRRNNFGDIYVSQDLFQRKKNKVSEFELFYDKYGSCKHFSQEEIESALDSLSENGFITIERDVEAKEGNRIYEKRFHEMEEFIVKKLISLQRQKTNYPVPQETIQRVAEDNAKQGYVLDPIQEKAIVEALDNKISIISGGPGSGKTFVTKFIVEAFRRQYPNLHIQLCAPTGKASRRMSDVIGMPACTLHKKLGFGSMLSDPIVEELLIVDECSMIDVELFYKLLYNVSDNTSIVLVGDYNQLPSVGPGLILRDLMDSGVIQSTILSRVFRQSGDSEIVVAANAVLNKDAEQINREYGRDFVFIERYNKQDIYNDLQGSIQYLIENGIEPNRIQIITPQNDGILGTSGLNNMMRELCNQNTDVGMLVNNVMFYVGDRIIATENNGNLGIYNGSIGTIISIAKRSVIADFDSRHIILSEGDMRKIKLGYAISVHRSQGAEFDFTFMPLIREHEFTLNKNLLYTAITRAKKMFVLIGEDDVLRNTVKKEVIWDRKSQIKEKLVVASTEN